MSILIFFFKLNNCFVPVVGFLWSRVQQSSVQNAAKMIASIRLLALVSLFTLFITVNSTASKMDYLVYAHVRTDPVTDPKNCDGKPGVSSHVHTYYGAAASLRPDTSYEEMRAACGNSGNVDDNKSLYWHPTIYRFDR